MSYPVSIEEHNYFLFNSAHLNEFIPNVKTMLENYRNKQIHSVNDNDLQAINVFVIRSEDFFSCSVLFS